jgi:membrane carboxypeptidase/penicillin-binding protein PbpC
MSNFLTAMLEEINKIVPFSAQVDYSSESNTSIQSIINLTGKIPAYFINVLNSFLDKDLQKKEIASSQLLELILYAQGKLRHERKASLWLTSGKVPQTTVGSISSMSQFKTKCDDLFRAHKNLKDKIEEETKLNGELKANPSNTRLHRKLEKVEEKKIEYEQKYEEKMNNFLESLNSLILGIGSEKL